MQHFIAIFFLKNWSGLVNFSLVVFCPTEGRNYFLGRNEIAKSWGFFTVRVPPVSLSVVKPGESSSPSSSASNTSRVCWSNLFPYILFFFIGDKLLFTCMLFKVKILFICFRCAPALNQLNGILNCSFMSVVN